MKHHRLGLDDFRVWEDGNETVVSLDDYDQACASISAQAFGDPPRSRYEVALVEPDGLRFVMGLTPAGATPRDALNFACRQLIRRRNAEREAERSPSTDTLRADLSGLLDTLPDWPYR